MEAKGGISVPGPRGVTGAAVVVAGGTATAVLVVNVGDVVNTEDATAENATAEDGRGGSTPDAEDDAPTATT